jgi:2',3'-cyclic-nucleotide 2'-phosphodiesterase (5'-nucleotidase family)
MKEMGYDVITRGNHEFDLIPSGLARILTIARQ